MSADAKQEQESKLSSYEQVIFDLLSSFIGQAVTRTRIEHSLYGDRPRPKSEDSNVIEVLISRLRRKLSKDRTIRTIRGVGYLLEAVPLCDVCNDEPATIRVNVSGGIETFAGKNCASKFNPQPQEIE